MKTKERSLAGALILAAVLFTILFIIFKVRAEAKTIYFTEDRFALEAEFKTGARNLLKEYGIKNPGINITAVSADGHRFDYEVMIHLPSYISLDPDRECDLTEKLTDLAGILAGDDIEINFS